MLILKYKNIWDAIYLLFFVILLFVLIMFNSLLLEIILIYSLLAVWIVLYRSINRKNTKKFFSVYYINCDLNLFKNNLAEIINSKFIFKRNKTIFQFYMVEALLDEGSFDQAFIELQKIKLKKELRYKFAHYWYLRCIAKYNIYMNDIPAAEKELLDLWFEVEKYKKVKKSYKIMTTVAMDLHKKLMFLKKDYMQCEEYFHDIFDSPFLSAYEKAFSAYYLGLISLENYNVDQAKEYFTFTANRGNTLFVAQKARELLEAANPNELIAVWEEVEKQGKAYDSNNEQYFDHSGAKVNSEYPAEPWAIASAASPVQAAGNLKGWLWFMIIIESLLIIITPFLILSGANVLQAIISLMHRAFVMTGVILLLKGYKKGYYLMCTGAAVALTMNIFQNPSTFYSYLCLLNPFIVWLLVRKQWKFFR